MAANYVLLERIELNASAASVTFTNIPQSGYTDLKVVMSVRNSAGVNSWDDIYVDINGSSTNFTSRVLYGTGSAANSNSFSSSIAQVGEGNGGTANTFSNTEIYFPNYLSTTTAKSFSADSVSENNATASLAQLGAGLWNPGTQAAISSLTFRPFTSGSFVQYSTFSLYGLAAVGTTPAIAPKASGGNIDYDGTYWIHTFLTSGTFTPQTGLTCDYLVVAGGGGGGGDGQGGGGGGGGLRCTVTATGGGGSLESALTLNANSNYTVTIGAGGTAGTMSGTPSTRGSNSVFSTITSTGGGGGKTVSGSSSVNGGSGGGGKWDSTAGGTGTSGQGYAGGTGRVGSGGSGSNDGYNGGGGGGAGAVGANAAATSAGAGGNGVATSISGSSVTYGGGGGGGLDNGRVTSGSAAPGGTGGGGAGSFSIPSPNGVNGTANLGGGGGGSIGEPTSTSGTGGSGIVIIRYLA